MQARGTGPPQGQVGVVKVSRGTGAGAGIGDLLLNTFISAV